MRLDANMNDVNNDKFIINMLLKNHFAVVTKTTIYAFPRLKSV